MYHNCGIYYIKNLLNEKIYVGQSDNLSNRKSLHFHKLKNNKHENSHLQNAYNLYGVENFVFEIILYCESFELTRYEDLIEKRNRPNTYNIRECVDSNKGIKRSEETKRKLSAITSGSCSAMFGKIHSDESRIKMSKGKIGTKNINSSSKYFGVSWVKTSNRWLVQLYKDKNLIKIGYTKYETEAAMMWNEVLMEEYGWKAKDRLNIITSEEIENLWNLK